MHKIDIYSIRFIWEGLSATEKCLVFTPNSGTKMGEGIWELAYWLHFSKLFARTF